MQAEDDLKNRPVKSNKVNQKTQSVHEERIIIREAKSLRFLLGPVLHGVGIMNSEMPYFQYPFHEKGYPQTLESNMVLALSNIGLYSKDNWGVRVEDTFVVTDGDPVYLTRFSKEFLSL